MNNYVLAMDLDGVLSNFNESFRKRFINVTGRDLFVEEGQPINFANGFQPPVWNYPCEHYGYTREEQKAVWQSVWQDAAFWANLEPLSMAASAISYLRKLRSNGATVYFPTSRLGVNPHQQTTDWLRLRMNFSSPQVLICNEKAGKGGLAAGLAITHFFDDKPENCFQAREACPEASVFLVKARYNEWAHPELNQKQITLVDNPAQVLRIL